MFIHSSYLCTASSPKGVLGEPSSTFVMSGSGCLKDNKKLGRAPFRWHADLQLVCGGSHSAAIACQGRKKTSVKHEKGLGSVPGQARLKPPSSPDCAELSFEVTSERDLWTTKRPTGHYLQKRKGGKATNPKSRMKRWSGYCRVWR